MRKFSEFNIATEIKAFVGDKISMKKVLTKEITVLDFLIEPSNFTGQRLKLQVIFNEEKRVIFCGSVYLMDMIKKVPRENLPFSTIIVEKDEHFEFT